MKKQKINQLHHIYKSIIDFNSDLDNLIYSENPNITEENFDEIRDKYIIELGEQSIKSFIEKQFLPHEQSINFGEKLKNKSLIFARDIITLGFNKYKKNLINEGLKAIDVNKFKKITISKLAEKIANDLNLNKASIRSDLYRKLKSKEVQPDKKANNKKGLLILESDYEIYKSWYV